MEGTKKEFMVQDDIPTLKEFVKANSDILDSLVKDGKTAQVRQQEHVCPQAHEHKLFDKLILAGFFSSANKEAYISVLEYYGENPKTTQPSMFFPLFVRFIKGYKVRDTVIYSNPQLLSMSMSKHTLFLIVYTLREIT